MSRFSLLLALRSPDQTISCCTILGFWISVFMIISTSFMDINMRISVAYVPRACHVRGPQMGKIVIYLISHTSLNFNCFLWYSHITPRYCFSGRVGDRPSKRVKNSPSNISQRRKIVVKKIIYALGIDHEDFLKSPPHFWGRPVQKMKCVFKILDDKNWNESADEIM